MTFGKGKEGYENIEQWEILSVTHKLQKWQCNCEDEKAHTAYLMWN